MARVARGREGGKKAEEEADPGELIEGADEVSFVLMAPGHTRVDIDVKAEDDRLRVESYDFKIVKLLRCVVDPSTAKTTFVNGVLSVRVAKRA
ncbi:MAG: Hsp20/alpha crystallin family protein [Nitrososphaerota archaeon]|jgi:HSP20 family molecular chaperone IbpA|nr:Hsp20/alpha crystallin family protein [Nitrososphaerota archaeon]